MALTDVNFALVCDAEFVDAGRALTAVGRHITPYLASREYGSGVKSVGVGLLMRELGHPTQQRRPKYTRKRRRSLLGHELEDTLEFSVCPPLASIRSAVCVRDLIDALRVALAAVSDAVLALNVPEFDTPRFLKDLDEQLNLVGKSSVWGDAEPGQFAPSMSKTAADAKRFFSGFDQMIDAPRIGEFERLSFGCACFR